MDGNPSRVRILLNQLIAEHSETSVSGSLYGAWLDIA
jgi:hypothetical protein